MFACGTWEADPTALMSGNTVESAGSATPFQDSSCRGRDPSPKFITCSGLRYPDIFGVVHFPESDEPLYDEALAAGMNMKPLYGEALAAGMNMKLNMTPGTEAPQMYIHDAWQDFSQLAPMARSEDRILASTPPAVVDQYAAPQLKLQVEGAPNVALGELVVQLQRYESEQREWNLSMQEALLQFTARLDAMGLTLTTSEVVQDWIHAASSPHATLPHEVGLAAPLQRVDDLIIPFEEFRKEQWAMNQKMAQALWCVKDILQPSDIRTVRPEQQKNMETQTLEDGLQPSEEARAASSEQRKDMETQTLKAERRFRSGRNTAVEACAVAPVTEDLEVQASKAKWGVRPDRRKFRDECMAARSAYNKKTSATL